MINRLQFIHHNDVFTGSTTADARKSAIDFLTNQYFKQVTRPSLYAEPLIVRYENKEKPNEPNVILAIGSKGSGSSLPTKESEYFIIDTEGIKDDVNEKNDKIEQELAKLAFTVIDSNTIHLSKEDSDKGAVVSGDVKIPEKVILAKEQLDNIILSDKDGIYSYVSLKFDDTTNTFKFQVNSNVEEFSLPVIENAKYDLTKESLVFTYTNGKELIVDLDDLIGEWTVEGEDSKTPIVLTRERIDDKKADLTHDEDKWHDILKADVRIDDANDHNILEKTKDGRKLFVNGVAENIYYKNGKNVKEAIDEIKTEVSTADTYNIIYKKYSSEGSYDGLAADVDIKYNKETNVLTFYYSDVNGFLNQKEFKLNSAAFIDDISYDTTKRMIIIRYKDEEGKVQKTDIDLSTLLDDWVVNSEAHNVRLAKQKNIGNKDVLTADVKITSKTSDNYQILEDRAHELYVKGTADNIVYDTQTNETVKSAIDRGDDALKNEILRAVSAETSLKDAVNVINTTIGSGFTSAKTESISEKFDELNKSLDKEISERKDSDKSFSGAIDNANDAIKAANDNITNIYNGLGDDYKGNNDSLSSKDTVTNRLNKLELSAITADNNVKDLFKATDELSDSTNKKIDELAESTTKKIDDLTDATNKKIDAVSGDAYFEVGETFTTTMEKDMTSPKHTVKANVKVAKNKANNLLTIDDNNNGLFVTIKYDNEKNQLIVSDATSDTHERIIPLNTVKIIDSVDYDETTEEIVIKFNANETSQSEIRVPLTKLISEWDVKNDQRTVTLSLSSHSVEGKDYLSADVNIPNTNKYIDNAIQIVDFLGGSRKGLYISANDINESAKTIADESAQVVYDLGKNYTDSVHSIIIGEINDAKNNAIASAKTYTDEKVASLEKDAAKAAKEYTDSKVSEEAKARQDADSALSDAINKEAIRATSAETSLNRSIENAVNDANKYTDTKANDLQTKITAEESARKDADTALSKSISDETTRAEKAESSLTGNIEKALNDANKYTDTKAGDLQTKITAEESARKESDNLLTSSITDEVARAKSAESTLSSDIDKSLRDAKDYADANDKTLQSNITAEETARKDADTTLSKSISDEVARATAAETQLTNSIDKSLSDAKSYTDTKASDLQTKITAEESARKDADSTLNDKITAETTRATSAESNLSNSINKAINTAEKYTDSEVSTLRSEIETEKSARQEADSNLSDKIAAETSRAKEAETTINSNIDKTLRDAKDYTDSKADTLQTNINTEVDARKTADSALSDRITAEVTRATSAETSLDKAVEKALSDANSYTNTKSDALQANITAEETARKEADRTLTNNLDAEVSRATNAEAKLSGSINTALTEAKSYAGTKAQNVQTNLDTEVSTRQDAVRTLTSNIENEVTRATSAEAALSSRINNLSDSITSTTSSTSSSVDSERRERQEADKTLQSNIDTEVQNRTNEDSKLSTVISNEATARTSADNAIRADFAAADTALDNKITAETAARVSDVKDVTNKISTEVTDRTNAVSNTLQSAKDYADSKDAILKQDANTYADNQIKLAALTGGTTNTASVTIADKTVKADVLVSAMDKNIIKKSSDLTTIGIYANPASLTYQTATNVLTFTDENGVDKTITLNSASFINSIGKSEDGKEIIISYGDTSGGTHTVEIDLSDLIDALDVDNTDNTVNLFIKKEERNGISTNVLSAEVSIANNTKDIVNMLTTTKKDGKGDLVVNGKPLYDAIASISGSTDAFSGLVSNIIENVGLNENGTKKGDGSNIQKELDDTQVAAGLGTDGTYSANTEAHYISASTSLADADTILDSNLYKLIDNFNTLSANTTTQVNNLGEQVNDVQEELDATEVAAFGQNTDKTFTYQPIANSNYISTADSLVKADELLDKAIKSVSGNVENVYDNISTILSADVKPIQEEIARIETGTGLDADGNYVTNLDDTLISGATSLSDADNRLSNEIQKANTSLNALLKGSKTSTIEITAQTNAVDGTQVLAADARLSLAENQTQNQLIKDAIPSNDNLLQVVKLSDLDNTANGIYFDGSIDYGELVGDDTLK